jgi:hypothetical protein
MNHFEEAHALMSSLLIVGFFTPFLFIRGLSCASCIQASLLLNCLKLTIPGSPYNCLPVSCLFKKSLVWYWPGNPASKCLYCLEGAPALNYSAEWSGWVWQPSADSNGRLAHYYCQQRAVTPDPESSNSNKKGAKLPLLFCRGLSHPTGRASLPSDNIAGRFVQGWRNPLLI